MQNERGLWIGLNLLGAIVGCGERTGTMSGSVSYNGEPVQTGAIAFMPADGNGPASGSEITNGAYRVTEVQPGPKIVKIEAVKQVQFAQNTADLAEAAKAGTAPESADLIPANAVGNNEQVTVAAGIQTRDFKLAKPKE